MPNARIRRGIFAGAAFIVAFACILWLLRDLDHTQATLRETRTGLRTEQDAVAAERKHSDAQHEASRQNRRDIMDRLDRFERENREFRKIAEEKLERAVREGGRTEPDMGPQSW